MPHKISDFVGTPSSLPNRRFAGVKEGGGFHPHLNPSHQGRRILYVIMQLTIKLSPKSLNDFSGLIQSIVFSDATAWSLSVQLARRVAWITPGKRHDS
jgi:hypothetical protein